MTDPEKSASLVFPGFMVGMDEVRDAMGLVELGVGGFCLYGGSPQELADLTSRLQERASSPLLFCADYEDGLATHCAGGTALPANMGLGSAGSEELAYEKGAITGREARALGVRWVLAPVCDLATQPENPIVNVRSFSADPAVVTRLARAYVKGLWSKGVLGCLKHFPGHGQTSKDSHLELPRVSASRAALAGRDMAPFRALAGEPAAVMTAHLSVPSLEKDPAVPYSLSADVARTLRGELGFSGLVSTDALNMKAVADHFGDLQAARLALAGGSDVLLVPQKPRELLSDLAAAVAEDPALAAAAAAAWGRLNRVRTELGASGPVDPDLVGCEEHRRAAARMAEQCLAWAGAPAPLSPGARARYWEPEADSPEEWDGAAFAAELREQGVALTPAVPEELKPGETLIVGSFLSPHAYSGRIAYDAEQKRRIGAALKRGAGPRLVSFGSPFVFPDLKAGGLCCFSRNEHAQRAAARALAGRLAVRGTMPVPLSVG